MWNFSKDDRKLILILTLAFTFIFLIIFLEIASTAFSLTQDHPSIDMVQNVIDLNKLPKNLESKMIHRYVDKIFELINKKNYEELYSLLMPTFVENHFPTYEAFVKYMDMLAPSQYTPKFSKYTKKLDYFIVNVEFAPKELSEDDITSVGNYQQFYFCVHNLGENQFEFALNGFIGTLEPNTNVKNDRFSLTLEKTELYYTSTAMTCKIENFTDSDLVIPQRSIRTITGAYPVYYKYPILVLPHSSQSFTLETSAGLSISGSLPRKISFYGITVGEERFNADLDIIFCDGL